MDITAGFGPAVPGSNPGKGANPLINYTYLQ